MPCLLHSIVQRLKMQGTADDVAEQGSLRKSYPIGLEKIPPWFTFCVLHPPVMPESTRRSLSRIFGQFQSGKFWVETSTFPEEIGNFRQDLWSVDFESCETNEIQVYTGVIPLSPHTINWINFQDSGKIKYLTDTHRDTNIGENRNTWPACIPSSVYINCKASFDVK